MRRSFPALLAIGLAAAPLGALAAQNDPRLATAVRLAQDGMSDSARAAVARLLASLQPEDSLYPEALYTAGLLAATERDRRRELRRVVVDYAQSAWADDGLLQLAQLDYAGGNPAGTVRQIEQLLRDYPGSPITAIAAFWGARAAADRHEAATACRMAQQGLAAVADDIELKNQLGFQQQRCQGLAAIAVESANAASADSAAKARAGSGSKPRPAPRAGAARPPAGFYVQISAVLTQAAANAEIARVKRAGYSSVVVKEAGYLKIRAGAFATREAALTAMGQLKARLGGRPFLVRIP